MDDIEQYVDEEGGLRINFPTVHVCKLPELRGPESKDNQNLMAYRCPSCHQWWRVAAGEWGTSWRAMSRFNVWRWMRNGKLPNLKEI